MSSQVLTTTPHNVGSYTRSTRTQTRWLSNQQTHSASYHEIDPCTHLENSRFPTWSATRERIRFPTWSTPTERAAYFPRVRCTTRDTGCLPIDSSLHWTLSTVNLEMKHRERHVCSKDNTTQRKRACNRRNTERRKNGKVPRAIQYRDTYQDRSQS